VLIYALVIETVSCNSIKVGLALTFKKYHKTFLFIKHHCRL